MLTARSQDEFYEAMNTSGGIMRETIEQFWDEQSAWSQATFGTDAERGPTGPLKHLAKEVNEVLADPTDLEEYADLLFLTFDATRRAGFTFEQLVSMAFTKLEKNKARKWSRPTSNEPVEHVRSCIQSFDCNAGDHSDACPKEAPHAG